MIHAKRPALVPFMLLALAWLIAPGCTSDNGDMIEEPETVQDTTGEQTPAKQDTGSSDRRSAEREKTGEAVTRVLRDAGAAANAGRHEQARQLYRSALDLDPGNAAAQVGFQNMNALLTGGTQDEGFDGRVAQEQARQVKANDHFHRGLQARAAGELDKSVAELTQSYQLLKFGPPAPGDLLTAEKVKRVLDETAQLKTREDAIAEQRRTQQIEKIKRREEEVERNRLNRKLQTLWDNAVTQFEAQRYERAERIATEILRLNFQDENARKLKELARQAKLSISEENNVRNYRQEWDEAFRSIKSDTVLPTEIVQFPNPDKWKEIADRGAIELSSDAVSEESERDREARARLENTVLPTVDWNGKTMDEVVEDLRAQANVNIFASPEAKTAAEDAGELDLELKNIPAGYALEAACNALGVVYTISDGIVKIQTVEESRKNKVVEIYNVADLINPINSFPGVQLNLNASGVGGGEEEEDLGGDEEVNIAIDAERLQDLIKRTVDPLWDDDDGNKLEAKNGTLIVRQTPEKQRMVRRLLDDLRQSTGIQVLVETRFITVENNFLQEIGVDLRGLGDDSGGVGVPGVGTNRPIDDFGIVGAGGVGTGSGPEGIGTDSDAGFFFSDRGGDTDVRGRVENLFDEVLGDGNIQDNRGGLSFQFAYLDDTQLEAILRAVQKYERINTLVASKLLVYNTQRAHLTVLNEIAYVKDFDVEIAQAAVIADPIVDKIRDGVVLDVRPIVSHDRRYVTMELRPTVATLLRPIRTFTTSLAVGAAVTFQLPELRRETVNTTVMIPDGGTLLLGGMKFAEEKTLESGVPILSDIPILSFFFSKKGKSTNLRDVIILLKVNIVILPELEPGNSTAAGVR